MAQQAKQEQQDTKPASQPVIIIEATKPGTTRIVRNEYSPISIMDPDRAAVMLRTAGQTEASISGATITLLYGLWKEDSATMSAGPKADSLKAKMEAFEEGVFGKKKIEVAKNTFRNRDPLPNSYSSTKASVLAFFAQGGGKHFEVHNQNGDVVGLWSLAAMRKFLQQKRPPRSRDLLESATKAIEQLGLDDIKALAPVIERRMGELKALADGRVNGELVKIGPPVADVQPPSKQ